MKNIFLLGASGSIGKQVIDILKMYPDKYNLKAVSVGENIDYLKQILREFNVEFASVKNKEDLLELEKEFPHINFGYGDDGLIQAATYSNENGVVINAVVGMVGLIPTIEAIKKRRDILLANKETLVVGGTIITKLVKEYQVNLIPIDSEHSAIFQALNGENKNNIKRIILTSSGGSFRDLTREELKNVTLQDALQHPNWNMGDKITIDSATMANKGLEVIEAHFLFGVNYDQIETVLHLESIVHSMVEFVDHSTIMQASFPDMRIPIAYALSYPDRYPTNISRPMDFSKSFNLTFKPMDFNRYPLLKLAYQVGKVGGIMPVVYNASNEVANELFRKGKISFLAIEDIVFDAVNNTSNILNPTLEEILAIDKQIRQKIYQKYEVI
ncbi:MAG TPA: 1-deoxy-D-xylulose-5-phosphate reductoisomerase, partial [Bacilli bacterium]|nr:1-deoxy-D-xylulose-5-phosphate reductoisomerase [Bacilli bacterium]